MQREKLFKKRFDDYYPLLCRIAQGYISHTDECEDIVQECFIASWHKNIDDLPEKDFARYMVRAVKNNCISFLRKQKTPIISFEDATLTYKTDEVADLEENEALKQDEMLERILAAIPPKCREVFLMSKLHGMKYKEIATQLGISEKTVENHMGKALKIIREQVSTGQYLLSLLLVLLFVK